MKAIILARVSTEEQKEAGNSLPAQLLRLQKYCNEKKFTVSKEFNFDESAWKTERDEFRKIIKILQDSKEITALCCDKIDRLIRNFTSDLAILEELRKNGKIELHFPSDNIILHKDSPATDLFRFTIGVSLAKYYSDSVSDNVKRAYEQKIKNGEWIGKAPIGYTNTIDEKDNKDISPDQTRAPFIIKIFELYANGNASMRTIKNEMDKIGLRSNTENHKPITISQVEHTLKNPFYHGVMQIKGKLYPHKYPPLISEELFNKAQEVRLGYHKKPFKYAAKPYILRGLIKCADPACGCTITAEMPKHTITAKNPHGLAYYSCTNYKQIHEKRIYTKESDLLDPIRKVLKNLKLSEKNAEELTKELRKTNQSENAFHMKAMESLKTEYDKLEKRISNMTDLRFDGSITSDIYDNKLKEYKEIQQGLLEEMQRHSIADESYYLAVNQVLSLSQRASEIFESSEPNEKRQLLNYLLQNCRLKERSLLFELKKPFDALVKYNKCPEMLRR